MKMQGLMSATTLPAVPMVSLLFLLINSGKQCLRVGIHVATAGEGSQAS